MQLLFTSILRRIVHCIRPGTAFTIASAPAESNMCFYIKVLGDWTSKLKDALRERISSESAQPLEVQIRGPFGAPAQHVRGYQRVILISGGVGATPFCSICKDLHGKFSEIGDPELSKAAQQPQSKDISKVEEELMSSVTQIYDESIEALDDSEGGDCDVGAPYSLRTLFAMTNECSEVHQVPVSLGKGIYERKEKGLGEGRNLSDVEEGMDKDRKDLSDPVQTSVFSDSFREWKYRGNTMDSNDESLEEQNMWIDCLDAASVIQNVVYISRHGRVLNFLHTVGMNLALFMVMLARIFIVALAAIFDAMYMAVDPYSSRLFTRSWIVAIDLSLGMFILLVVSATICLEMFTYRWAFFEMRGRTLDLCLLLPSIVLSLLCQIFSILEGNRYFFLPAQVHVFVVLPLVMMLLIYRLHRIIGSRVLLADSFAKTDFGGIRAIDFIWTVPYGNDDDWLREELSPLANGTQLRLHRFLTREQDEDAESVSGSIGGLTTTFG